MIFMALDRFNIFSSSSPNSYLIGTAYLSKLAQYSSLQLMINYEYLSNRVYLLFYILYIFPEL
jgi:hypothetical protein